LVAAMSHFPELKNELGLLGSGRNANLAKDEADAPWAWVSAALNSLASNVPFSIARGSPDGVGE
jgi:hypothetical protein